MVRLSQDELTIATAYKICLDPLAQTPVVLNGSGIDLTPQSIASNI